MNVPPTAKPADPAAITIALPPALLAELPPGEPGAKPLPKPGTAATWRQRFIDKGDKLGVGDDLGHLDDSSRGSLNCVLPTPTIYHDLDRNATNFLIFSNFPARAGARTACDTLATESIY